MPSPFPGMDPYLEDPAYWSGFHTSFLAYVKSQLARILPAGYYADVEQHVWLDGDEPEEQVSFAYPDGYVAGWGSNAGVAVLTASAPTSQARLDEPIKKKGAKYVKIVDALGNRIVTVIELLSPANKKKGKDRKSYLAKRGQYLLSETNIVEIDLLRSGERLPMGRPRAFSTDYIALVSRAEQFPRVGIWSFGIREQLPVLPIPLKPEHGDVTLSLRTCMDQAYVDGRYEGRIDYARPPKPPLNAPDAEWAKSLFAKPAKKSKKKEPTP